MSAPTLSTSTAEAATVPEVLAIYRRHLSRGRARLASLTGGAMEVASDGAYVWDSEGKQYLDCGGYGVFLLGHRHPKVVEAVIDQIRRHPMATRILLEPVAATAAQKLAAITPPGLDYVHFVNSGAEATETAIKLARAHGKHRLISATGGYHGKTTGALAVTAKPLYQDPFRPLLAAEHVPYGDAEALEKALAGGGPACVILEPVQGEGGVVIPPPGYLAHVQRLCAEHGTFFVLDEIQTGLGRLGSWWGADAEDIRPDVLLVGKNLSGGVIPVAAAVATETAYAPFNKDPFLHTSTFAAAPVAMAAAAASVAAIGGEGLVERAALLGADILSRIEKTLAPLLGGPVTDIRGQGLLLGIELANAHAAGELVLHLMEAGLLVNHSLNAHTVVRLTPPAVLSDADLDRISDAFTGAATALSRTALSRKGTL
ncbi:aminotransferase class III-fold pyridoxal phosphate-dependent enzyme [Streptomyces goshikiensis]|uniref:Aspartate aminotransferase family protein n=2 Tax=Streptomyces TaxID=1883 RepID=A0A5D4JDQ7_9ACTN|nr:MULTISPECIES: aminotransferase class III-fold pyridoxal phosphate-dependent enzyme [Streptomyces]ALO08226.1 Ornithine aminotransferase [Streptomyces venezuelae]QPK45468.1 aspartate aminotransferase family protein [Streptomyces gardneri]TYR63667.1 aspartate aminotransferase family protein [Streptomyces parvus]WRK36801.1 aminotransferase class III-fold pyridoxal phosphate-dependent enzyme [Streptomyces venezuelae]CUM41420.1 Acetylornithine aminotransferase [Streptomyces venezuelae]